jgi:hypothetical protein
MFKRSLTLLLIIGATQSIVAQHISGIATKWNDTFVAWEIFATAPAEDDSTVWEEYLLGTVQQRWLDVREDWTEWDFTLDGRDGTIKLKWKTDPSQWELRTYEGTIITMKTIWNGDNTAWRIDDGEHTYDLKSRYTSDLGEWSVKDNDGNIFKISVTFPNDPRDWTVQDGWGVAISYELKLAMLFVVTSQTSPKQ